jgi:flagellar hook-associated protein 1 FlgK
VSFAGTAAHQAQQEADMSNTLLTQATEAQQSISGVNLDEEAANLERYQRQYQAAAKVMQIAASLFDSILAIRN